MCLLFIHKKLTMHNGLNVGESTIQMLDSLAVTSTRPTHQVQRPKSTAYLDPMAGNMEEQINSKLTYTKQPALNVTDQRELDNFRLE